MIGLSTLTYDPAGALVLPERPTNPYDAKRRGSITATLDGGVSVYDTGYSVADQTLVVRVRNPKIAVLTTLRYLIAYYNQITLCCETGAYTAIPSMTLTENLLVLQLRLLSRVDE